MGGSNAILLTVAVVLLITAATAQNLNCTFETDFCAWTQSTADQQNWARISGKTLTANTGPNGDHTTSNGYYIYLETSVGNVGSKAQLLSPTITVPASRGCLQFWYSMYGEHVGDLTVYSVVGQSNTRLWTRHGNMGLPWKQAFVDVPAGVYMKLMFEATRGNGYLGDIAIDDISFSSNGICQGAGLGCDFEGSDMCGYVNNPTSVNKWIWGSGSTSSSVRPDRDHSTRTVGGHYVYVDSSMATPTTNSNTHAQLMTKSISGDRQRCLRFFYSMGGAHPGSLNIYTKNATLGTALWALRDFNGAGWMTAEVNLPARSTAYQVVFLVQVYATHSGAISIDDVNILDGSCRNPATCNFEQSDLCTWSNDQADQFDWIINRGGTSTSDTGPSNDFTYGNSTGENKQLTLSFILKHYSAFSIKDSQSYKNIKIYVNGLYSDVIPIFSRPACFNFMYHMKGSDIGTLNFYVKYGLTTMKVWTLSGDQGTSWNSGSFPLPIGARYSRSQILIEGITTAGYKGDIALDDLSLTTIVCQVNPPAANPLAISTTRATTRFTGSTTIPPNLPTVTCNFEGGFCGWTQMTGNNANWTRFRGSTPTGSTGPTGDHTTGNGYYIYLEADNARYNSKARLQSITITPRQNQQCFSFWYLMKGASIGALNIYVKLPSQTMQSLTPLWRRSGAQGNAWLKDSLTIPVGSPYAVVIEAVRGLSVLADIAVDDVSLVDGPCADVTTTRSPGASTVTPAVGAAIHKCDFEDGTAMCGFTQDVHDDFNWGLTSQGTGTLQTGPTNDHTYQTPLGHYAFIDASNQRIGAKAKLVSPTYNDYGKGDLCLHFFYYMYGDGVGTLNVYVQPVSQSVLGQPLWRMSGNQGQRWIVGAVPLHIGSLISGYQIIFEGVRGSNFRADIAIDDITVTVGACPNPGACDFENGRCSWTKDRTSTLDWGSLNPDTAKLTPPIDHSTSSARGTFLFLFSQTAHTAGDKVGLVSETFPPTSARCMNFWYFMSGNVQSYLNILITTPGSSNVRMVWQLKNQNQGPSWRQARVPIPSIAADYFITIQGVYGADMPNPNGGIGIDDISFLGYSCALFPPNAVPSVGLPINTTPSVRPLQGSPNCDFESGICAWRQDTTDDFDWTSRSGQTPSGGTGPIGDHSKSDGSGKYIYIETSAPQRPGQKARLISPDIGAGSYCVQFYYNMFGQTVGNLNLYVMTGLVLPTPLWSKSGTQGQAWKYQSVDVSSGRVFNIVFEGTVGSSYSGDIALDDILVTNGTCSSVAFASGNIYNSTCTFETDLCGFTQDTTDNFDWDRHKGYTSTITTGPTTDHTLQTPAGYYIYVESSAPRRPGDKARIETKTVPGNAASSQCVSFWYSMYGSTIGTLNVYLKRNGVLGSVAWFRIHDQGSGWKQATFSVPAGSSSFSVVFEGVVGNGIYSDIALDDITIMNSDCSHPGNCNFDTGMCTWKNDQTHDNFDWLITSQSTGSFNTGPVQDHTMNNATGKYVFIDASAPRVQGDKAWFVSQDLSPDMPSCLKFWYNMNGPTVGTLNIWVKQSSDNSLRPIWSLSGNQGQSWMIGQALIPRQTGSYQVIFEGVRGSNWNGDIALDDITFDNTSSCGGQSMIHSYGHRLGTTGKYLYLETSSPNVAGYVAILSSELFGPRDYVCFHFFYNMYGASIGTLRVRLVSYNASANGLPELSRQVLWELSGNQNQGWKEGVIPIVPQMNSYKVFIEGVVGFSYTGDIGIDDLKFTTDQPSNCRFTPSNAVYTATTAVTVTQPSANIPAGFQCNFDTDLCGWQQDQTDQKDWIRLSGSTPSASTGPSQDHTSGHGFYMYLETSVGHYNDTARLISPQITDNSPQCFTFWYHMYGTSVNSLDVQLWGTDNRFTQAWQTNGTQGNVWKQASINIGGGGTNIAPTAMVVLEAVQGSSFDGDIAIDDINLVPGMCSSSSGSLIDCDFESPDICGYLQDTMDVFDWTRASGGTDSYNTGPTNDHTYKTSAGHYLYTEASGRRLGDAARIWSRAFTPKPGQCLSFFYHMYGAGMGNLSISFGQWVNNGQSVKYSPVWSLSGPQPNNWIQQLVPLPNPPTTPISLVFEGDIGSSYLSDIAIDDIKLQDFCSSPGDCTFETGLCGWLASQSTFNGIIAQFMRTTANAAVFTNNLPHPVVDHTLSTGNGSYMILVSPANSARQQGQRVNLVSDVIRATGSNGACFHFWFVNYGATYSFLSVATENGPTLWRQNSTTATQTFTEAQLPIISSLPFKIVFNLQLRGGQGYVALDDFSVTDGFCQVKPANAVFGSLPTPPPGQSTVSSISSGPASNVDCNFEKDLCFWHQNTNDQFDWTRLSGRTGSSFTGPSVDHTLKTDSGFYLYIETSSPRRPNDTAVIESPGVTSFGAEYILLICNISSYLSIKANVGMSGPSCDFETDLCEYVQDRTDNYDWIRQSGSTTSYGTGPTNDHSYGTRYGHYMYTEANNASPGQSARLIAPQNKITTDMCLEFWYHMYGSGQGTLSVKTTVQSQSKTLWTKSGNQGNVWNRATFDIPGSQYYTDIIFEEIRGRDFSSDTAIDDIVLKYGKCSESNVFPTGARTSLTAITIPPTRISTTQSTTTRGFLGFTVVNVLDKLKCNFETPCQYQNDVNDKTNWLNNTGSTSSIGTGPPADHTLGTVQGWIHLYILL
uniref:MAM domain-containing protein n=1 Tax=Biomphalaria glabrata TaxID=6526 RepID=A0A2C9KBP7_BIOGL